MIIDISRLFRSQQPLKPLHLRCCLPVTVDLTDDLFKKLPSVSKVSVRRRRAWNARFPWLCSACCVYSLPPDASKGRHFPASVYCPERDQLRAFDPDGEAVQDL